MRHWAFINKKDVIILKKRKTRKTINQLEYEKQVRRIKRAIREGVKQGYIFNIDFEIPEKPKRITKKYLEKLSKITRSDIYAKAVVVDYGTGEITPASEIRAQKKRAAIKKAQETRKRNKVEKNKKEYPTISFTDSLVDGINLLTDDVENLRTNISSMKREASYKMPIEYQKNELLKILDDMLFQYEDNMSVYTDYLKSRETEIFELMNKIQYDSDDRDAAGTTMSFVRLASILNMGSLSIAQAEQISDMSEFYEGGYDE